MFVPMPLEQGAACVRAAVLVAPARQSLAGAQAGGPLIAEGLALLARRRVVVQRWFTIAGVLDNERVQPPLLAHLT